MNAKLQMIQRKLERENRIPAPDTSSGLGQTIENLIADEVERRVGEAVARRPPSHVQQMLDRQFNKPEKPISDYRDLPATPRTAPKKALQATVERDGAGLARAIVVNGQRFLAQRDGAGQLVGMISDALASPQAADIPYKAEARQYQPGKPRKLFGNDPEE